MRREVIEKFYDKWIRISLRNGYNYSGEIQAVDDQTLVLKDKFGKNVVVSLDTISSILETIRR